MDKIVIDWDVQGFVTISFNHRNVTVVKASQKSSVTVSTSNGRLSGMAGLNLVKRFQFQTFRHSWQAGAILRFHECIFYLFFHLFHFFFVCVYPLSTGHYLCSYGVFKLVIAAKLKTFE
jgi:hypothetical protein